MGFIILLILSTLSIAGSAAFFSVYGLAKVFSGSFLPVVIMASALESGKLITASLLYRYWHKMTKTMKGYLMAAVIVLMAITSMGIFGYLSAAYQDNIAPFEQHNQQIALLESEKSETEHLKLERLARQEEINKQIANLPNNMVSGRRRLIDANKAELDQISKDIAQYTTEIRDHTTEISKLKNETIQQTAHVGPIIFIARVFGTDINTATKWLVFLIMFVFDPLAVMLTIATNMVLAEHKNKKEESKMSESSTPQTPVFTTYKFEPSDPPVYSEDKQLIQSKDGLSWSPVAPHAAAGIPIGQWGQGATTIASANPYLVGAAQPTSAPFQTITIGGPQDIQPPPSILKTAFDVFTKPNLTPQEKRMKEELEALLKRHQEVLDANELRSKS